MQTRKRMLIATFVLGFALFVNLALVNSNFANQDDGYSKTNSEDESLIKYLENDYKLVKNEDGTIFLVKDDVLEESTIESFDTGETKSDDVPFVDEEIPEDLSEGVKRFEDFDDLRNYLDNHSGTYYPYRDWSWGGGIMPLTRVTLNEGIDLMDTDADGLSDGFSSTNVQEIGVDEGDILKNDGNYAYIVSKDSMCVFIVDVNPASDMEIVSTIKTEGSIREIYVKDDTLVILGYRYVYRLDPFPMNTTCDSVLLENGDYYYFNYISYGATFMEIYDISDREEPELQKTHIWRGNFLQSRMIGDYVYLISYQHLYNTLQIWDLPVPANEIFYFGEAINSTRPSYYHQLLCVRSVNIEDLEEEPNSRIILMRSSGQIYVSLYNIYITDRYYRWSNENTTIHRISISDGTIVYKACGEVPGWVMSRFSMDEQGDYFRIATTKGWSTSHGVYVLDMDMNMVGSVEDIAPNERMYSARFVENRVYLVTFRRVDPFWVIDLSDPENPEVLGELIIPGWSDYLHPYDENHVIGLGREAQMTGGWEGVKLTLFNVTDVENPTELTKYVIGDGSSSTIAANNPHAFLFDKEKNLLVIPVEFNRSINAAYVFESSLEDGFVLRDTIEHPEDEDETDQYRYRDYDSDIYRSFYIGDALYTLSYNYLMANHLSDLGQIDLLDLPNDDDVRLSPPIICLEIGHIPR
jgi:hypothetical protein